MEHHEGTSASSAQGTSPPSPASPPTTTAATTSEAGQRREKKRPPKSSSSQFFTLLSHGASHVQKLVGVEGSGAGGVHHPSLEESHLLSSTHLDDDEHDQVLDTTLNSTTDEEREKDGRTRRRQRVSVTESTSSRYREEANIRLSSPAQPSVSEPNLTASTERVLRAHNLHHRKAVSETPATAPVPRHKRVRLVPPKEETINRNYFFLREYRSDSDSSTSDTSDDEEENEAKQTEKNSEGENENEKEEKERKRREDGGRDEENDTEEEKESAHKEAEEPGTVVGGSESINWDGAKQKVVKRKQRKGHKKGMSGGWVMKKVLVLMGSADKVKGMVTRNKRHKSRRSRRPRSRHHVVMENTDGEDELYEMVDLHHDVGGEDYDTTDVEACEEVDEVEAQKAREEQAILFLISLCRALHKYGAPAHRLEYNLHRASESLGIEASFAVMPSLILISVGPEDNRRSETHIIRSSQSLNCAKLFWTDDLIARMANNEIELPDAVVELASITRRKPLYPLWLTLLSFGVCSAACAPLFYGGGWLELAFSFGLGLMTGVLDWLSGKIEPLGLLISAVAAILCAFFTRLFIEYVQPICYLPTVLSGIIWLLPGLSITISITELATGNMISGTTRIFSAIIKTLQLGFGMTLGMKLVMWTSEDNFIAMRDSVSCSGIGGPWTIPLFLCVSITFNLLLEAHPRQWGIMMVTALLSLTISEVTAYYGYFSDELASALAAFAVGAVGNIHARISGHPAIVSIIAGVLLLVPGSIGVKGVKSLMEDDVVSGIQFGFSMLTIALSICVGLLTANLFNLGKKHLGF